MSLKVGIVGLPNVGKSTLFNALRQAQGKLASNLAYVANYPFATIEPNVGVVPVPDQRLDELAQVVEQSEGVLPPKVPATVEFVDIAGLVAGAHEGEGLGNKFLAHIREVDAIVHVIRAFADINVVRAGSVSPKEDLDTVETELALADLETVLKQKEPKGSEAEKETEKARWGGVLKIKSALEKGLPARTVDLTEKEYEQSRLLNLLTAKPILVVLNVDEQDLVQRDVLEEKFAQEAGLAKDQVITICAKVEAELAEMGEEDARAYLAELGAEQSGLERLIKKAFSTLGLITFLTAGVKEVRAWTIKNNTSAVEASGVIHTDFIKEFIKAEVVSYEVFVECGGWAGSRRSGKARLEGKDYVVRDGDVVEFKIGA